MKDYPSTTVTFADHYRTGKYADLRLITSIGTQLDVHRLIVCSQSPVLDAKAKTGTMIIELDDEDDATTVEQMVEWMYGIDDEDLLMDRKTVDEVVALGPDFVCGEILAVAGLAGLAAKYRVPKLEAQALEMVNLLIANLTSFRSILETVHQLAPESALGTVQRNLISQALDLVRIQGPNIAAFTDIEARPQKRSKRFDSDLPVDTGHESQLSNIDVSPDRTYDSVLGSDAPLLDHHNRYRRTTEKTHDHHSRPSTKDSPHRTPKSLTSQFTPINQPSPTPSPTKTKMTTTETPNPPTTTPSSTSQRKRRPLLASLAISTALPPNSPPLGPHCHCHASADDPTLVPCEGCRKWYHPRCVGKGSFAKATYNLRDEVGYMLRDVERFVEDGGGDGESDGEVEEFRCGNCDKVYFG